MITIRKYKGLEPSEEYTQKNPIDERLIELGLITEDILKSG